MPKDKGSKQVPLCLKKLFVQAVFSKKGNLETRGLRFTLLGVSGIHGRAVGKLVPRFLPWELCWADRPLLRLILKGCSSWNIIFLLYQIFGKGAMKLKIPNRKEMQASKHLSVLYCLVSRKFQARTVIFQRAPHLDPGQIRPESIHIGGVIPIYKL